MAFPISPTALNRVIRNACNKAVVVAVINGVTEPCAYVVKIDGVALGDYRTQYVIDQMGGKGNIVAITGVPGVSYGEDHHKGFKQAVARHPDINVLAGARGHVEPLRGPPQDARAAGYQELGRNRRHRGADRLLHRLADAGGGRLVAGQPDHPCAGESANGNRLQMLPVDSGVEGALGKSGQSIGSGLWAVSYTFKTAMEVLDGDEVDHLRWYTGVEVTQDNVKLCENGTAEEFAAGCNTSSPASCLRTMPSTSGRPRCPSSASGRPPKGSWTTTPERSAARPP